MTSLVKDPARQAAIAALSKIIFAEAVAETPSIDGHPSPNETRLVNAWSQVNEIRFMNQFNNRRSRYSWTDIGVITAVILLVGGCAVGFASMILDNVGPECLVVHCVKVIR